jgi:hypothetical protein
MFTLCVMFAIAAAVSIVLVPTAQYNCQTAVDLPTYFSQCKKKETK